MIYRRFIQFLKEDRFVHILTKHAIFGLLMIVGARLAAYEATFLSYAAITVGFCGVMIMIFTGLMKLCEVE